MPLPCNTTAEPERTAILEALLFLRGEPLTVADLSAHTGWTADTVRDTAAALQRLLLHEQHGITLLTVAGGYQLATKKELHDRINWVRSGTTELSAMALEVLSIIAFKQPITRAEIEKLRGVSSGHIVSALLQQGLIQDLGRKDTPGRPILYGTSPYFLECIGLNSLDDLTILLREENFDADAAGAVQEEENGTIAKSDE